MKTWKKIDGLLLNDSIRSVIVIKKDNLYIICILYGINMIGYFTLSSLLILKNTSDSGQFTLNTVVNTFNDGRSLFYFQKPNISINSITEHLQQNINDIIYNDQTSTLFGIGIYSVSIMYLNLSTVSNLFVYENNISYFLLGNYSAGYILPDCLSLSFYIIENNKKIKRIINNNNTNQLISIECIKFIDNSIIINDIYIYDINNAIAVGNNGKIIVTYDNGLHWENLSDILKNVSDLLDNEALLSNNTDNIINVCMSDDNTFIFLTLQIIASVIKKYLAGFYFAAHKQFLFLVILVILLKKAKV